MVVSLVIRRVIQKSMRGNCRVALSTFPRQRESQISEIARNRNETRQETRMQQDKICTRTRPDRAE